MLCLKNYIRNYVLLLNSKESQYALAVKQKQISDLFPYKSSWIFQ